MGVVSLTMGNSRLPFGNGLVADAELVGQLCLRQFLLFPQCFDGGGCDIRVHVFYRSFPAEDITGKASPTTYVA